MMEFEINEKNKSLWDSNFIKVEGDDSVMSCGSDGVWKQAEPMNNDYEIQEFGGVTDLIKYGYMGRDYKIFKIGSIEPIDFITKEPLKLYDVVILLGGWEEFVGFVVFMGTTENDTKYLFKYSDLDSVKHYTLKIK